MEKLNRRFIIFLTLFFVLTGVLGIIFWPFIKNILNPEYRKMFSIWVAELGFRGIIILFGIQILQVVVSVIPGGPVELIAGAAYGAWFGLLIIESGCAAATVIIFFMVRKFGLPLINRFFGSDVLNTWGFLENEKKTALITFILFLIPGTPKDTLTYLAPLSSLSMIQFTLISVFARFPAVFLTTVMGDTAMQGNWAVFILVFSLTAVIGILSIHFKEYLVRRTIRRY
jgi:uncharacterized membrane protein YdjX (TVP38/TMEM64 family)